MLIFVYSFECPDFAKYDPNKCYLSGEEFDVGEKITSDNLPNCRVDCRCEKPESAAAQIECASVECPDLFQRKRNRHCISQYDDLTQCCRTSGICGK